MKSVRFLLSLFISLILLGCGLSTPVKLDPQSTYSISSHRFFLIPKRSKTRKTLLVSLPVASPGYETSKMIYMKTNYQLKHYANNRWVAPPAEMLLPLLTQRIRSLGYFHAVVAAPFSGETNYRLDTQLIKLQQEFFRPTSIVRLVMQVTLVNNTTNRIVASHSFQVMVSAPGNNPYSGVLAANKAADIMCQRIARFVEKTKA